MFRQLEPEERAELVAMLRDMRGIENPSEELIAAETPAYLEASCRERDAAAREEADTIASAERINREGLLERGHELVVEAAKAWASFDKPLTLKLLNEASSTFPYPNCVSAARAVSELENGGTQLFEQELSLLMEQVP